MKPVNSLFITPETGHSLGLYSSEAFETLATRLSEKTTNRAEVQSFLRLFYSRADTVDLDGQGRIRIPDRLVVYAGLEHDVVLVGVHDHAEIWARQQWEAFLSEHSTDFDQLASKAFE